MKETGRVIDLNYVRSTFKMVEEENHEGWDFYDKVIETCRRLHIKRSAEIDRICWEVKRLNVTNERTAEKALTQFEEATK